MDDNTPSLTSKALQRAANKAANKILAAGGYDHKGMSLQANERRALAKKRARAAEAKKSEHKAKKGKQQAARTAQKPQ